MTKQESELLEQVTELLAQYAKLQGENEQLKDRLKHAEAMNLMLAQRTRVYQPDFNLYGPGTPWPYIVTCSSTNIKGETSWKVT